jgi:hypothetical protein
MTVEPLVLSVVLEGRASGDQASAVESVLAHYGIAADVGNVRERRSADTTKWVIKIALVGSIPDFFQSFGSTFGKTAARDASTLVRGWIKALFTAAADEGSIEISDSQATTLVVATGVPDEALDALARAPWDQVRGRYLMWNDTIGRWDDRPAAKE